MDHTHGQLNLNEDYSLLTNFQSLSLVPDQQQTRAQNDSNSASLPPSFIDNATSYYPTLSSIPVPTEWQQQQQQQQQQQHTIIGVSLLTPQTSVSPVSSSTSSSTSPRTLPPPQSQLPSAVSISLTDVNDAGGNAGLHSPLKSPSVDTTPTLTTTAAPSGFIGTTPQQPTIFPLHQSALSLSLAKPTALSPLQPNPHLANFHQTSLMHTLHLQSQIQQQIAAATPSTGGAIDGMNTIRPPNSIAPLLSSSLPNMQVYPSFTTHIPSIPIIQPYQYPPQHHTNQALPPGLHYQSNPYTKTSRSNCTLPLSQLPNGGSYAMLGQRGVQVEFGNDGLPMVKPIKKIKFSLSTTTLEDIMQYSAYMGTLLSNLSHKIDTNYLNYLAVKTEYEKQTGDIIPTPYYYPKFNQSIDPTTGRINHARISDFLYFNQHGHIDLSVAPVVNDFVDVNFTNWQETTPITLPPLPSHLHSRPITKDDVSSAYTAITSSALDSTAQGFIVQMCKTQLGSLLFQQTLAILHADAQCLPRPSHSQCSAVANGWCMLGYQHPCPSLHTHRSFPGNEHITPAVSMNSFVDFLNATNPPGLTAGRTHKVNLTLTQVQDNNKIVSGRLFDALCLQLFTTQRFMSVEHAKFLLEALVNYLLTHIQHSLVDICTDVCGNYILQTLIPFWTQEQYYQIAMVVAPRLHELSCHNQSTRVVQALFYHAQLTSTMSLYVDGLLKMNGVFSYYVEKITQHYSALRAARLKKIDYTKVIDEDGYQKISTNQSSLQSTPLTPTDISEAQNSPSTSPTTVSNGLPSAAQYPEIPATHYLDATPLGQFQHYKPNIPVRAFSFNEMRTGSCGFSQVLPSQVVYCDHSIDINNDMNLPVQIWKPVSVPPTFDPKNVLGVIPSQPIQNCFCQYVFPNHWNLDFGPTSPYAEFDKSISSASSTPSHPSLYHQHPGYPTTQSLLPYPESSLIPSLSPAPSLSLAPSHSSTTHKTCFCSHFHHHMASKWIELIRSDLSWHALVPIMLRFPLWILTLSGFTSLFSTYPSILCTTANGVNVSKRFLTTLHPKHLRHYFQHCVLPYVHDTGLPIDPLGNFVIQQLIDRTLSLYDIDVFVNRKLQYNVSNAIVEEFNLRQQYHHIHTCRDVLIDGVDPEKDSVLKHPDNSKIQATLCALLQVSDPTKLNDYVDDIFATPISLNGQGGQTEHSPSEGNGEVIDGIHVTSLAPVAPLNATVHRPQFGTGAPRAPLPFNPRNAWAHQLPSIVDQTNEVAMFYFRKNFTTLTLPATPDQCCGCVKFESYKAIAADLVRAFGGKMITKAYSKAVSCIFHHFFASRSLLYTSVTTPLWQYISSHGIPAQVTQEPCGRSVMNRLVDIVPTPTNTAESIQQHQHQKELIKATLSQAAIGHKSNRDDHVSGDSQHTMYGQQHLNRNTGQAGASPFIPPFSTENHPSSHSNHPGLPQQPLHYHSAHSNLTYHSPYEGSNNKHQLHSGSQHNKSNFPPTHHHNNHNNGNNNQHGNGNNNNYAPRHHNNGQNHSNNHSRHQDRRSHGGYHHNFNNHKSNMNNTQSHNTTHASNNNHHHHHNNSCDVSSRHQPLSISPSQPLFHHSLSESTSVDVSNGSGSPRHSINSNHSINTTLTQDNSGLSSLPAIYRPFYPTSRNKQ